MSPPISIGRPTTEADFGRLSRVATSMWNTRMLYTGDFAALADAVAAIEARYPAAERINCYEWATRVESALELAPLVRAGGRWKRGDPPAGTTTRLDWQIE